MTTAELRKEAERLKYRGRIYYLHKGTIYDARGEVVIEEATNGFLDLYELFEYFPPNEPERRTKR